MLEENDTELNDKVREIPTGTENEDVIHIDITENETGNIWIPMKR